MEVAWLPSSQQQARGAGGVRVRGSLCSSLRASQKMVSSALRGDRAWSGPEMTICFERRVCRGELRTLVKVRGWGAGWRED